MPEHTHVVGSGPVALAAALRLASSRRVALHLSRRTVLASHRGLATTSIEAVPAATLALLVELGVHPFAIGARALHRSKRVAWESPDWIHVDAPAVAHLERPALEHSLFALVQDHPNIDVREVSAESMRALAVAEDGQVFDATGRRSRFALSKHVIEGGPIGRTWTRLKSVQPQTPAQPDAFQIAALPEGYVYRLASECSELIGWCGSSSLLAVSLDGWNRILAESGLTWQEVPTANSEGGFAPWQRGKAGSAGAQRCMPASGFVPLGDAAYARDVLCSQGLAIGLSDAMYALDVDSPSKLAAWNQHRHEQYVSHLVSLLRAIGACRYRASKFWRRYADKIEAEHETCMRPPSSTVVRMRYGRIEAEAVQQLS